MRKAFIALITAALIAAAALFIVYKSRIPLNVVLVSIDTLRPDHLGCYGYHRNTSLTLDRLAHEGVLFKTVVSSTTWTLPAHVALLTSLPDPVHGVLWDNNYIDPNRITLAEIMKEHGYRTGGFFTGPYLLQNFGFDQGFDDYIDCTLYDKRIRRVKDILIASEGGSTTPKAMEEVEKWLDKGRGRPFFLFIHLFDVHPDFDPPSPYDTMFDPGYSGDIQGKDVFHNSRIHPGMPSSDLEHLIALYDGEIRFVDEAGIARLVKILRDRDLSENTLIVITSDHGEEFFEHGDFAHRKNLYDTTLKIPLIFWQPGLVPEGKVIKDQVGIIDIMPTILDLVGIPQSKEGMGKSLALFFKEDKADGESAGPTFAEITHIDIHMETVRTDEFKLIMDHKNDKKLLFNYKNDPAETSPMKDQEHEDFKKAAGIFDDVKQDLIERKQELTWDQEQIVTPLDPELVERLKALGYVE